MEATFEVKGKQFTAKKGDVLEVPFLGDVNKVEIDKVMVIKDGSGVKFGKPYVENAKVVLEKMEDRKKKKIIVFKFKRRKDYKRTYGHRQKYSVVKVADIVS